MEKGYGSQKIPFAWITLPENVLSGPLVTTLLQRREEIWQVLGFQARSKLVLLTAPPMARAAKGSKGA